MQVETLENCSDSASDAPKSGLTYGASPDLLVEFIGEGNGEGNGEKNGEEEMSMRVNGARGNLRRILSIILIS